MFDWDLIAIAGEKHEMKACSEGVDGDHEKRGFINRVCTCLYQAVLNDNE